MDANPYELAPQIWMIDNERKDSKKFHVIGRRLECILISAIFIINPDPFAFSNY